jgi:hypothetical protein
MSASSTAPTQNGHIRKERQRADDGVERLAAEIERLRVPDAQLDLAPEFARPGNLKHRGTQLDAPQPHTLAVVLQVATGADPNLEHLARRLRANPPAPTGEKQPVEEAHLAVVLVRLFS